MSKREKVMRASVNERTSSGIASIAGTLLDALATCPDDVIAYFTWMKNGAPRNIGVTAKTAKAGFASLLTQTRNKEPIEVTAKRKKKAGKK